MSSDLYSTMFCFERHRGGFAKAAVDDGVSLRVDFKVLPDIEGLPKHVTEVFAYPQLRDFRLRESSEAIREMYPPEIEAIRGVFATLASLGRRFLRTGT